jgi:superfamily II DNA or RNA helicase
MVERGDRALPDLLANVLIRRTRNHVLRWYGRDAETDEPLDPNDFGAYQRGEKKAYVLVDGEKQFFPRRRLQTIEYSIEESYNGLYDELRGYLGRSSGSQGEHHENGHVDGRTNGFGDALTYARYGIGDYVLPEKQHETRYRELKQAGGTLRGLMRILLFKRFESSVEAFRETVKRLLSAHKGFAAAVEGGKLPAGKRAERILTSSDLGGDAESEEELLKALGESGGAETYDVADFDAGRLIADVRHDADLLEEILALVEPITPEEDAKLQRLKEELDNSEIGEGKVLIFTQYADTARYLYDNINPEDESGRRRDDIDVIFSGDKSKERAVGRFSPTSNPEFVFGPGDTELSKLIATDVLSEGLNLQDCDKIINYDLHWNPVRLIQRFGRIDRIGTTFEEIHGYNFLPETGIEENLGLKQKLQQRIKEIQETIGEDGKILDPSEQVNDKALYAIYGTDDGDQQALALFDEDAENEDLVDLSEAIEMFRLMREEDPDEFNSIASLRDGIRAARRRPAGSAEEDTTYVFCRAGDHRRFYAVDRAGEAREVSTQEFLGALRCEFFEQGIPLQAGHNAAVAKAKERFTEHLQKVRAQRASQAELPRGQRYALKELQKLYGQLGSEDRR